MRKFVLLAAMAVLPLALSAARLTLRDGTVVYGRFVSGTEQNVIFQDDNGVRRRFDVNQIQTIDFSNPNTSANDYNNPYGQQANNQSNYNQPNTNRPDYRPYNSDQNSANRSYDDQYANANRYQNDWALIPAGTQISVRTDEGIDSQNAVEGRTFPASIVQDVMDQNGNVVIPRGSPAQLVVRRVTEGGTLSSGNFVLDLDSVRVNGRRYVVNTGDVSAGNNGIGKNKRTAEYVGGGAVLGTLLGAVAGGGKGAAIGALAGAAAGGGAEVLTKGKEIRVPPETVLNFRLDQPLHLREATY